MQSPARGAFSMARQPVSTTPLPWVGSNEIAQLATDTSIAATSRCFAKHDEQYTGLP